VPPTETPLPTETPTATATGTETPTQTTTPDATQTAIAKAEARGDGGGSPWLWILLVFGLLIMAGAAGGYFFMRSRQDAEVAAFTRSQWQGDARMVYGKASALHDELQRVMGGTPATAASHADDVEWLNRMGYRLDEIGAELGMLAASATTPGDRSAAEGLLSAVTSFRETIDLRLSPRGAPADYPALVSRQLFELNAAIRAFQTTL
jgi:hypothetical protein